MKKFEITNDERKRILEMHIKRSQSHYLMEQDAAITPPTGTTTPSTTGTTTTGETKPYDITDLQNEASAEGITGDVSKFANQESPVCAPPMTGDGKKDTVLKSIFSWAKKQNVQTLKSTLKNVRQKLRETKKAKKEGRLQEQAAAIVIAGVSIGPGIFIAIGALIIIIILAAIIRGSKKRKGGCNPGWWDNL
jgi:hypothetical protein